MVLCEEPNVSGMFSAGAPDIRSMLLSRADDLHVAVLHQSDNEGNRVAILDAASMANWHADFNI